MVREELQRAASHLETASESTDGETMDRLLDLAGQLDGLATRDRGPDHGRMARIQNALGELEDEVGPDARTAIEDADAAINEYRETVEGV